MELFGLSFAFGTAFWVVATLVFFAIMASVESEKFVLTTPIFLAAVLLLTYLSGNTIGGLWAMLRDHPGDAAIRIGEYIVLGILWGATKWYFRLAEIRKRLIDYRHDNNIATGKELSQKERDTFLSYNSSLTYSLPPRVSENKRRFTFWMFYWPFSLPWTLLNNPVKKLFNAIYNHVAGVFQAMSDRMFRGLT